MLDEATGVASVQKTSIDATPDDDYVTAVSAKYPGFHSGTTRVQ